MMLVQQDIALPVMQVGGTAFGAGSKTLKGQNHP
jgi:hypothetical protein